MSLLCWIVSTYRVLRWREIFKVLGVLVFNIFLSSLSYKMIVWSGLAHCFYAIFGRSFSCVVLFTPPFFPPALSAVVSVVPKKLDIRRKSFCMCVCVFETFSRFHLTVTSLGFSPTSSLQKENSACVNVKVLVLLRFRTVFCVVHCYDALDVNQPDVRCCLFFVATLELCTLVCKQRPTRADQACCSDKVSTVSMLTVGGARRPTVKGERGRWWLRESFFHTNNVYYNTPTVAVVP